MFLIYQKCLHIDLVEARDFGPVSRVSIVIGTTGWVKNEGVVAVVVLGVLTHTP